MKYFNFQLSVRAPCIREARGSSSQTDQSLSLSHTHTRNLNHKQSQLSRFTQCHFLKLFYCTGPPVWLVDSENLVI